MQATVGDLMTHDLSSVNEDSTLDDALQVLLAHSVDEIYVVNEFGQIVGVLTDYEILKAQFTVDLETQKVSRWMNSAVPTVAIGTHIDNISVIFRNSNYKQVAVVKQGKLAGVIRRRDIMRFFNVMRSLNMSENFEVQENGGVNAEASNATASVPRPQFLNKSRSLADSLSQR